MRVFTLLPFHKKGEGPAVCKQPCRMQEILQLFSDSMYNSRMYEIMCNCAFSDEDRARNAHNAYRVKETEVLLLRVLLPCSRIACCTAHCKASH